MKGKVGEPFSLIANGTDSDNDALFYRWDFGDGTEAAYGKTISHTYFLGSGSTFVVTCTAVDGRGGSAEATILVAVEGSDDPINSWTQTTLADTGNFSFATYGGGQFLVGGDGGTQGRGRGARSGVRLQPAERVVRCLPLPLSRAALGAPCGCRRRPVRAEAGQGGAHRAAPRLRRAPPRASPQQRHRQQPQWVRRGSENEQQRREQLRAQARAGQAASEAR